MALNTYSTGTVSVTAGGTTVTGSGTIWSGNKAVAGDEFVIGGVRALIVDVVSVTELTITPWPGGAESGASYAIYQTSSQRFADVQIAIDAGKIVDALNTEGFYIFVPSTATAPDPSLGDDGQFAFQAVTGKLWLKESGVWTFLGIYKGFNFRGAYDAGATYSVNDVFTSNGSAYIVTSAPPVDTTPPNATYYDVLAAKGDKGEQGDTGATPLKPIEAWATATDYVAGPPASFVSQSGSAYECLISHTSGTFSVDLAAGKWGLVASKGTDGAGVGDMVKATYDPDSVSANSFDLANIATFTRADAVSKSIPSIVVALATTGYADAGDGGAALYKRVASEPSHAGKFQSGDGAWWELSEVQPNELMFGAVPSASNADQTAAIQSMFDYVAANAGRKGIIVASHTITSTLSVAGGVCIEWGEGGQASFGQGTLIKGFNGDMITIDNASVLVRPQLNGVGATYTGSGIVVTGNGDQIIVDGTVTDTDGPCISVPTADTCRRMRIQGGIYYRHTVTDAAIVFPSAAETVGGRVLLNCMAPDSVLIDLGGANDISIIGGDCTNILFSSDTKKARLTGVRIANAAISATLTVSGIQHSFSGCIISGDVTLSGSNIAFGNDNVVAGTLADTNTGSTPNIVSIPAKTYTMSWTAASVNPSIGNGTISAEYERDGNYCIARGLVSFGSTTTFGTGTYSFSLPIPPYTHTRDVIGTAFGLDSGTAFLEGVSILTPGDSTVHLILGAAPVNSVGPTVPITWVSGDRIEFEIRYRISSTGNS